MSGTYARGDQEQITSGGILIGFISLLSAVLVLAGLIYATGIGERQKAALAAAGCEPNLSPSGLPCTTASMLTAQFIALTTPVINQLTGDMLAYGATEGNDLPAAEAALTVAVRSAKAFNASLMQFPFPPTVISIAEVLIRDNEIRIQLTAEQARSASITQLQSFDDRVKSANAAMETEITIMRKALNVPPTANQEP